MSDMTEMTAGAIARQVTRGTLTARAAVEASLTRIAALNGRIGAFTDVLAARARAKAAAVDAAATKGPLAGVPFAVKNLFDLQGLTTRAGSKINRDNPPASRDATLVERLEAAGAICLGALNMGEYAYDFTGENAHDGPSRNPHDLDRMSGGSSGGSGSAVAAGFVPLALGSDTNGSIRVPSSLCGLFGLKPTYGRLTRARTFPFVASLDHLGPMARSVEDLALSYDAMQGFDAVDGACADRPVSPTLADLDHGITGLRIATLGGYFATRCEPEALRAVSLCAAYLITTTEGAALHLERLRHRADEFDPATRDRLIAGAMVPAAWVTKAHKIRRTTQAAMRHVFEKFDVLLAPATPCVAPLLGQTTMTVGGQTLPVRANLGLFTQPLSFIGLPVAAVPVWLDGSALPIGVQVIGPAWREDRVLQVARVLEKYGIGRSVVARL
jgi:aspartyl-tRNA(Asn)/glutamyl-tRNA(Gln) amidotransferase subunit A